MAASEHPVLRHAHRWLTQSAMYSETDADLIRRFTSNRDETAFAALVDRHGAMVLGTARRAVRDYQVAEDVFQATFLALVRSANHLRQPEALPAWLHRTAYHLGVKAARARDRRLHAETRCPAPLAVASDELSAQELLAILDAELARLPQTLRLPLVLCCLEGLSQDEAASRLGWTPGSVRGRLERARCRLRDRLNRRGLSFAVGVGTSLLLASPAVADPLRATVVRSAVSGASPSPTVAALIDGVAGLSFRTVWLAVVGIGALAAGLAFAVGTGPSNEESPTLASLVSHSADTDSSLPDGAVARLGWSPNHIGNSAFALTPDGKEIVAVSPEGTVRRFDAVTGKLLGQRQLPSRLGISPMGQSSARLSADGKTAAISELAGNEYQVTMWDVPNAKVLFKRTSDKHVKVGGFALSPDGKVLALRLDIGERTVLSSHNVATGKETQLGDLEFNVYDMQFSTDGAKLVLSEISAHAGDGPREFLTCFDVAAGKQLWKLPNKCVQFALSPNGRTVAYASFHQRGLHIIETDPDTGKVTESDRPCGGRIAHPNIPITFAPDNHTLVGAYFDSLASWDLQVGKEVGRIPLPAATGSGYGPKLGAFSADGKTVVTNIGMLQRWDLATGKPMFDTPPCDGLGGPVESVAFTPDGKRLFASGWSLNSGQWDVESGKQTLYRREQAGYHQLVSTPVGLRSVSYELSNKPSNEIAVHDPIEGKILETVRWIAQKDIGINGMRSAKLATDGRTLLVVHGDEPSQTEGKSYVTAHDIPTGRRLAQFSVPGDLYFWQSPFSPSGRWVVLAGKVYHVRSGTELFTPSGAPGEVLVPSGRFAEGPVWFSMDGRLMAGLLGPKGSSTTSKNIAVWEMASGKILARFPKSGLTAKVVFGPDDRTIALADASGVHLYDLLGGNRLAEFTAPDITCEVNVRGADAETIVFSPDGRTLATGHRDGSITLWAVPRMEAVKQVKNDVWVELGAESPAVARAAIDQAVRNPAATMKLMTAKFRPTVPPANPEVATLIKGLDDDEFAVREKSTQKLRELGAKAERPLREALNGTSSAETRRRIMGLLDGLPATVERLTVSGDTLRGVRAIEVLERIATDEARELIAGWANQTQDPQIAAEARATLDRIAPVKK